MTAAERTSTIPSGGIPHDRIRMNDALWGSTVARFAWTFDVPATAVTVERRNVRVRWTWTVNSAPEQHEGGEQGEPGGRTRSPVAVARAGAATAAARSRGRFRGGPRLWRAGGWSGSRAGAAEDTAIARA